MTPNGFGDKEGQNNKTKLVYEKSNHPVQENNSTPAARMSRNTGK
jgi:hypothetical protein